MKTLPDSPSLDHLRRQAKDLHRRLKASRPDATLSDAQTLVAEQYGYRTWPDLKAEVERRNGAVRAADDGMAAALAEAFGLGEPQGPLTALERQWAGQAWVLTTDRGRWLARQLFDWFDGGAVEHEVALAEAAADAGIVTPRPVRSAGGAVIEPLGDSRWRVYEYPALGPELTAPVDPSHARAAGRVVGRVHALALPADMPVQPWVRVFRNEEQWEALARAANQAGVPWADALAAAIPGIVDVTRIVEPVAQAGAPVLSPCHFAPNAFRIAGDDLAVTSWEHAGAMPPRWDLGGALAQWGKGVRGDVSPEAARSLLAGYAEHADLPALDLGVFSADVCAGLNWLATRIQIALSETEDRERREVAARSVPGLLADPPSRQRYEALLAAVTQAAT